MAQLALAEGGVIEIVGKRSTPARAVYPYPEDEGLEIIRIDGLQRANAGAGSGEYVEIRKIESKPATRSEEHTSELQTPIRTSYAVFYLTTQNQSIIINTIKH